MTIERSYNPHADPHGRPYELVAQTDAGELREGYWTSAEALDRRDELLDQGVALVRIIGLPTTALASDSVRPAGRPLEVTD